MSDNLAIAASAGTGKTYNLAVRYIRLILNNVNPETVVALTFSRLAANEIFDRVVTLLSEWINDHGSYLEECQNLNLPACKREVLIAALIRVIKSLHKLPVGTLDSFFINILNSFSLELGLPAGFNIMDEHELHLIREKILSKILHDKELNSKYVKSITDAYRLTTIAKEGKSVTETFLNFINYYHEQSLLNDVSEWGVLNEGDYPFKEPEDLSNTADELIRIIKNYELTGSYSKTFFNGVIKFIESAKYFVGGNFDQKKYLIEKVIPVFKDLQRGECLILGYRSRNTYLPFNKSECEMIIAISGSVINKIFKQNLLMSQGVESIINAYEEKYSIIRNSGKLTFDDVKLLLAGEDNEFTSNIDNESKKLYIDYRLDSKYKHWLLDEFQDTSRLQWKIIENLIDEVIQNNSGDRSLFYVGDIKQAIYGWRNGDAQLFNELVEKYSQKNYERPLKVSPLNMSYRSAKEIMDLCNNVFSYDKLLNAGINSNLLKRWEWEPHNTNRKEMKGYVEYGEFKKEGRGVSDETLCRYIANKIKETDALNKGLTVAVLVRSNSKGLSIYNHLRSLGVDSDLLATVGEVDSNAEKLIHSLILYADHPGDTFIIEHLNMSPFSKYIKDSLSCKISLMIHERGYAETVSYWSQILIDNSDLSDFSKFRLNDLTERSRRFDSLSRTSSLEWKKYVTENPSPIKSKGNAVQILTIHKSKGLQYDMVFLPQLQSNNSLFKPSLENRLLIGENSDWAMIPPSRDFSVLDKRLKETISTFEQDSFYESLCVFYVAITRAKYAIYMLGTEPPKNSNAWYFDTILRNTLSPLHTGEKQLTDYNVVYSDGNEQWCDQIHKRGQSQKNLIDFENKLKLKSSKCENSKPPSKHGKNASNINSMFLKEKSFYADIGIAVHELFEGVINYPEMNKDKIISTFLKNHNYNDYIKKEAISVFESSIQKKEVQDILTLADGENVWNEKKISAVLGESIITGIIDRLTLTYNSNGKIESAKIVDYKTDNIQSEEDFKKSLNKYSSQLKQYQKIVAKLTGLEIGKISTFILFVRSGKLKAI